MISTDKAANPSTVMGKTKKFCELIVENFNRKNNNGIYLSVRFGNVFNSSGSVIQIFKHQIKKGQDLTLTDADVTRFFMSIEEAVKLVIKASIIGKGGEVFVLDMGTPIKILDIAKRMIHLSGNTIKSESNPDGDIGITITGLKKGEKLHEILSENPVSKTEHPQILLSTEDKNEYDTEKRIKSIIKAVNENDQESMKKILD
jgi:FlaA1/EpsC-like NDP-sugar epimerase